MGWKLARVTNLQFAMVVWIGIIVRRDSLGSQTPWQSTHTKRGYYLRMSFYAGISIKGYDSAEVRNVKQRVAKKLAELRIALDKKIPAKRVDGKLLLATWNIREFGEGTFRHWGFDSSKSAVPAAPADPAARTVPNPTPSPVPTGTLGDCDDDDEEQGMKGRLWESIYYIAEIINRFDLVALQEVRDDLEDFNLLLGILGSWWKFLVTDVTGGAQGNRERVAFLYDERKVRFGGLAGEVVLPPGKDKQPSFQLARTPYLVGFRAGWFRFTICSTHLYYGTSKADDPQRLKEMDLLAGFLADEVRKPTAWARNMVLLGDFNIFSTKDAQFKVLTEKRGFTVPKTMIGKHTNVGANHPYDQIAFIAPSLGGRLEHSDSGTFPFFDHVFTEADEASYASVMGSGYLKDSKGRDRDEKGRRSYYRDKWRTFQMSDHNPLWIELDTDFGDEYLKRLAGGK